MRKHSTKKKHSTTTTKKKHSTKTKKRTNSPETNIRLLKNSNDIRMLLMPYRNETQTASIFFYFKVGSKNEPLEINGISHFIEHMIFKGSPKFKSYLDISKTFDANGISFNAFTSKDMTAYHYKFLSTPENLEIICKITSDMILNPLMREKDIDTERNVIIQEMNDDADDIDEFIGDTIECRIFDGHPLGNTIIGTLKTLNDIKQKELLEYHKKYYRQDNLLIAFSGNMQDKYTNIINKYFSKQKEPFVPISLQTQGISQIIPYQEKHLNTTIECFPKKLKQDYVHIIFKTKGVFDPLYHNYKLLANILGGNMSSRLFVEIREKLGLVYSIKCSMTNYEEVGYFDIETQNEHKDTFQCIKNILLQLTKIKKNKISSQELEGNIKNYCDIFASNFDDIEYENEFYSKQILYNKSLETATDRINKIKQITINDILDTANNLFDFNKIHIITFGKATEHNIKKILNLYIK
jgi:predicted Zn-dependent peptidase